MRWFVVLTLMAFNYASYSQEICDNGIDDDGDMLIDLNDTAECVCNGIEELTPIDYIPNGSFEEYDTCPTQDFQFEGYVQDWGKPNNVSWISYLNTCGYYAGGDTSSTSLYLPPLPLSDGGGFIGGWSGSWSNSYFDVCLNEPFLAGETYIVAIDVGFRNTDNSNWWISNDTVCEVTLYGNDDCNESSNSFTQNNYTAGGWTSLASATVSGNSEWVTAYLTFTPTEDTYSIMFSGEDVGPGWGSWGFFFYDNIRVEVQGVNNEISIIYEDPCDLEDSLKSPTMAGASYQWYKDGIALVGETDSFIVNVADNYGLGWYQTIVSLLPNGGCQIIDPIYFGQDTINAFGFSLDTSLCAEDPITINIDEQYGTTTWNTEETGTSISIGTPGQYTATVQYDGACTVSKSILIEEINQPTIEIWYSRDDIDGEYTLLDNNHLYACSNQTIFFTLNAENDYPFLWHFEDVFWNGGSADTTYAQISNYIGVMDLTVLANECYYRDTVNFSIQDVDEPVFDTTICANQALVYNDSTYYLEEDGYIYHTVKNELGCDSMTVLVVTVKDSISSDWALSVDSCSSECTGLIIQNSTDAEAPVDYQWSHNSLAINQFNLCAGDYSLTMTDATGCSNEYDFTVPESSPMQVNHTVSDYNAYNISCNGGEDGSIDLQVMDGYGSIELTWNDGNDDIYNRTNLPIGTYSYTLTDSLDCEEQGSIVLNQPALLTIGLSDAKNLVCYESEDGSIQVESMGGIGDYNYQWTPNITSGTIAENLDAGDYEIVVVDANNCTDTLNIQLTQALQILPTVSASDVSCFGYVDGSVSLDSVFNNIGDISYSLNGGPFKPVTSLPVAEDYLFPGTYTLTVKDSNKCVNSITVTIDSPDSLTLVYSPMMDTTLGLGQALDLSAFSYNPEAVIQWSDNVACANCNDQSIIPTENMTISVTVLDTISGCFRDESFYVDLLLDRPVYIPNAFSPNDDGENDIFTIFARENAIANIEEFSIFNRTGSMVFSVKDMPTNDLKAGWDGFYEGEYAPMGIYVYYAVITFIDGKKYVIEGEVSLVR